MRDLIERLMFVNEGWKTSNWYSWWIAGDKLIDVGNEQSMGDHYGTLYIMEDPNAFGLTKEDQDRLKEFAESDEDVFSDPEEWGDIVNKVMKKCIRLGVHKGGLYADIPTEDDGWLHAIQAHRKEIEKTNPKWVTIEVTFTRGDVNQVSYDAIPIDDFWSANKLADLRAYKNV